MKGTFSGGCLCGYVRYEHAGEPGEANYCHCPDCRRTMGSAFGIGVRGRVDALRIVSGRVKAYTKIADNVPKRPADGREKETPIGPTSARSIPSAAGRVAALGMARPLSAGLLRA